MATDDDYNDDYNTDDDGDGRRGSTISDREVRTWRASSLMMMMMMMIPRGSQNDPKMRPKLPPQKNEGNPNDAKAAPRALLRTKDGPGTPILGESCFL